MVPECINELEEEERRCSVAPPVSRDDWTPCGYRRLFERDESMVNYVLHDDNTSIGVIRLLLPPTLTTDDNEGVAVYAKFYFDEQVTFSGIAGPQSTLVLFSVVIAREFRRQGLGSMVLEYFEKMATRLTRRLFVFPVTDEWMSCLCAKRKYIALVPFGYLCPKRVGAYTKSVNMYKVE